MNWIRQFLTRGRMYRDLSEEIEQHLAEKIEALMAGGMSREEAEHRAKREFGNVTRIEERGREAWMWPMAESIVAECAVCHSPAAQGFRLCHSHDSDACTGHWRDHGHLQPGERSTIAAFAVSQTG